MPRQPLKCLSLTHMVIVVVFSLYSKNFEIQTFIILSRLTIISQQSKFNSFFPKANLEFNKYCWVLLGNISCFFDYPTTLWVNPDFLILALHIGKVCSKKITPIPSLHLHIIWVSRIQFTTCWDTVTPLCFSEEPRAI